MAEVSGVPMVKHFLRSNDGATAIEYALIAGFLVLAIVGGTVELGQVVAGMYGDVAEQISNAGG